MGYLPEGTVTFPFSDIEGSTRLLKLLGRERYRAVLQRHNEVLRVEQRRADDPLRELESLHDLVALGIEAASSATGVRISRSPTTRSAAATMRSHPRWMRSTARVSGVLRSPSALRCRASGASRRWPDIAQALFVTPKTVEVRLSSVYRKLEIGSRAQLPAALGVA